MQLLYEILPVFLFFLAFKFYDMYVATVVGIVATFIQVILSRLVQHKWDTKQLITLSVFLVFGGMTLYFHNPIFIKWKPTIVFWIFALVIVGSQILTNKPLMQRLMEHLLEKAHVPSKVWKCLNITWGLFFFTLGSINLYVAYSFSNNAWVNFKFYGITLALIAFSVIQAFYLMRFVSEEK